MEKIFKKINLFMGVVSLISIATLLIPFVEESVRDLNLKDFIVGTLITKPHYVWGALIFFPAMILILHLLEHLDKKVSHQDLMYSILMIIGSVIFFFMEKDKLLIGFYVYGICAIILFIFSLIRYFAFKRA